MCCSSGELNVDQTHYDLKHAKDGAGALARLTLFASEVKCWLGKVGEGGHSPGRTRATEGFWAVIEHRCMLLETCSVSLENKGLLECS